MSEPPVTRRHAVMRAGFLAVLCLVCAPTGAKPTERTSFDLDYYVAFDPESHSAKVRIDYRPGTGKLRHARLNMPAARYLDISGDGTIEREDRYISWTPPKAGGSLSYRYRIDNERSNGAFDARITSDVAILRGDDLIPPVKARVTRGADSKARLHFDLPAHWSVDTPYVLSADHKSYVITQPHRRFDRPVGWMIAGDIGVRRERIGDMQFAVAGPKGEDVRRTVMLAFVHAAGLEMLDAFGELPAKVLVVSAGDPMWRGGLSGPRSLFLHGDRPTISENGTSTLMHELTHVLTGIRGGGRDDWIAEGIAEYYSIELLRRARLLSDKRAERSFRWMRAHGKSVRSLRTSQSSGPRTARAVTLFKNLDAEIRSETDDRASLDDVVRALKGQGRVDSTQLKDAVETVLGKPAKSLETKLIG